MNYFEIECPKLGILHYEEEYDWYEGSFKVQQSEIPIRLLTDEDGKVTSALERATDFIREIEDRSELAKEYAAKRLLQIKNETWIEDGEEPLTIDRFKQQMTLESVSIDPNGEVSLHYNDGDLFWGHSIVAIVNCENRFMNAEIEG